MKSRASVAQSAALAILMGFVNPARADDGRWVHLANPLSDGTTIWINLDSIGAVPIGTIYNMEIRHKSDHAAPEGHYWNIATSGLVNCQNSTVYARSEMEMGGTFYDQNGHQAFVRAVPAAGGWQAPPPGSADAEALAIVCAEQNRMRSGQPPQPTLAQGPAKYFLRMSYQPAAGKAGYHLISHLVTEGDDMPGQDSCGGAHLDAVSVDGTLPDGLVMPSGKSYFEGTPQEPGDWDVTVHAQGISCVSGPDRTNYGNRDIHVHFHIEGDAARNVDALP